MNLIVRIYDYFSAHRPLYTAILAVAIIVLTIFALRLHYTEDILSFMPFNDQEKEQFSIYQQQANTQTITLIFEGSNEDLIIDAINRFEQETSRSSIENLNIRTTINTDLFAQQIDSISRLLPFLLNNDDYHYIDSVLTPEYINRQIAANRTKLLMPQSGMLQPLISTDPLNLFSGYLSLPQQAGGSFDIIDGYIFSADHSRAIAFLNSPYGSNESGNNAKLVKEIDSIIAGVQAEFLSQDNQLNIRATGAPVISVGNAGRIKRDSAITISIALIAIALLLLTSLKRKRDILWLLLTIAFGMLFALGIMGMITTEISLIVLGISSVIVGIAVNYPLHLIVHRDQRNDMTTTLKEVISPLVVGNITTVGAFLCLVPLQSKALHDLGLFSALMLIGTILFTILFLPQLVEGFRIQNSEFNSQPSTLNSQSSTLNSQLSTSLNSQPSTLNSQRLSTLNSQLLSTLNSQLSTLIDRLAAFQPHTNKIVIVAVLLLTVVFSFFAPRLSFDSNLNNINYMTPQQRADIDYFLAIAGKKNTQTVYICQQITDPAPYLQRWNDFWQQHNEQISLFAEQARLYGFRDNAFAPFLSITNGNQAWLPPKRVIHTVEAPSDQVALTETVLLQQYPDAQVFDIQSLNSQLTNTLSDNFDYIGLACSLIVLIFLCINLRSVWLGLIAFTPMLIAWVWILGIMYLFGLQFNIVNIILATFIFGQGDDYTIFITEGLIFEHETGKPILTAYKRSIILSALIMFVGIGVLVIARHPAMHSLGVVTILGMICVVSMAYIIPPVLYQAYLKIQQKINKKR